MCAVHVPSPEQDTTGLSQSNARGESNPLAGLKVKLYADGADLATMIEMYTKPYIQGFTTNPTLMRKSGVEDYCAFARDILEVITDRPISFEVFADDFSEMEAQALEIASWGDNVIVKIPVTNTRGERSDSVLKNLSSAGVKLNVTAVLTLEQVWRAAECVGGGAPAKISVFAGRIADTGRDPLPVMAAAVELLRPYSNLELIWASPRELLNVFQAEAVGCHVITATTDILKKLNLIGRDLREYSLETVKMFYDDARKSDYQIPLKESLLKEGVA